MSRGVLRIETARNADAERLAGIRVETMRPSLQAVGRFDPERARHRFLGSFQAVDTKIIYLEEKLPGSLSFEKKLTTCIWTIFTL